MPGLLRAAPALTLHCVDLTDTRLPPDGPLDLPGAIRALRRRADLSQREVAARSRVPPATVAGIESGSSPNPRLRTVERVVAATGARLAILDLDGSEPACLPLDERRDRALRRYPPHLDVQPVSWRGGRRVTGYGFIRSRRRRDDARRRQDPGLREGLRYEVRRLQPGDAPALEALRSGAADLDPVGRPAVRHEPLSPAEVLRYLRDPSLRHWVAEERLLIDPRVRGRILGHLAARLHLRPTGPPVLIVVDFGVRPECRTGLVGIRLIATMSDEAALLGVDEIVALAGDQDTARLLRSLGFGPRLRRESNRSKHWSDRFALRRSGGTGWSAHVLPG